MIDLLHFTSSLSSVITSRDECVEWYNYLAISLLPEATEIIFERREIIYFDQII